MSTDPQKHHGLRDRVTAVLDAAVVAAAISHAPVPTSPDLTRTHDTAIAESVEQLADHKRKRDEDTVQRALEDGLEAHRPRQVEERPDTRSER